MENKQILMSDIDNLCFKYADLLAALAGKSILVTGATGLIGYTLVNTLLRFGQKNGNSLQVLALVRNIEKAKKMYADFAKSSKLSFVVSDIIKPIAIERPIDYIIHGASQTSSKAFVTEPVETIKIAFDGSFNMLELAKKKNVSGFVYLSSMEVYGAPEMNEKIKENHSTNLNTTSVRASYPESKRMCESLCCAYASEYGIPAKVARLTQTFGPGVAYNDDRVFTDFARSVIENRDIVLHTKGETKRNYLYTTDAAAAILTVLLKGEKGEAYNVANEESYCSIYEMADLVARRCAQGKIKVVIQEEDCAKFGYAPILKMNLDTTKLRKLGWEPTINLEKSYHRLIQFMLSTR